MEKGKNISKAEMILVAAQDKWPEGEFTAEDLVIACWEKFPDSFGLQGYTSKYPDSNIVFRYIMGKDSIVKKQRWLSQKGQKRYVITPAGLNHVLKLRGSANLQLESQQYKIDRFYEQVLHRILTGCALSKFKGEEIEELTFTDACGFWSINPRSSGEQLLSAGRDLAEAIRVTREHIKQINKLNGKIMLAGKIGIASVDLDQIEQLDKLLREKFKDQLDLIERRITRWGKTTGR